MERLRQMLRRQSVMYRINRLGWKTRVRPNKPWWLPGEDHLLLLDLCAEQNGEHVCVLMDDEHGFARIHDGDHMERVPAHVCGTPPGCGFRWVVSTDGVRLSG